MTTIKQPKRRQSVYTGEQVSNEVKSFYNQMRWRKTSKDCFERDGGECVACYYGYCDPDTKEWVILQTKTITPLGKEYGRRWSAHHINPLITKPIDHPLNYDLDNLITVCESCHSLIHNKTSDMREKGGYINKKQKQTEQLEQNGAVLISNYFKQ